MIIRVTQSIARKMQVSLERNVALCTSPLLDWSLLEFQHQHHDILLFVNTASLHCTILPSPPNTLCPRNIIPLVVNGIKENFRYIGQTGKLQKLLDCSGQYKISDHVNRSVAGSINRIATEIKVYLDMGENIFAIPKLLNTSLRRTIVRHCNPKDPYDIPETVFRSFFE